MTENRTYVHTRRIGFEISEKECFANFKIEKTEELTGVLEELEQSLEQIKDFITSLGENDIHYCSTIVAVILKVAHQALDIFQKESAYIILRSFIPNSSDDDYKLPRWHQDGYYYAPYCEAFLKEPVLKAAIPLKGADTLFYRPTSDELEKFKQLKGDREQAAELLVDITRTESTPTGHESLFIVGETIHSEPYITRQRFFMSVLPGNKKQIQEYDTKQKMLVNMKLEGKSFKEINKAAMDYDMASMQPYIEQMDESKESVASTFG